MKADPADCFGIGEDACLYGFVLARGVHSRIHPGDFHGSRGLYAQARTKLEQLVQFRGVNRVASPRPGFSETLERSQHRSASRRCEARDPSKPA